MSKQDPKSREMPAELRSSEPIDAPTSKEVGVAFGKVLKAARVSLGVS
jgi:hypothetical protein